MSNFWESKTGETISGKAEDAYAMSYERIPNNTKAEATIKTFLLVVKEFEGDRREFYEIVWKINAGPFKGREVSQKIKPMDANPNIAQRGLNMLKLVYNLCNHTPTHSNQPTDQDHRPLVGRFLGIKINEWSLPKRDGSGFMEGNFVSEVHPLDSKFTPEVGVKKELPVVIENHLDSAMSRNPRGVAQDVELDMDVPF
jgi:hypothetical protein